MSTAITYLIPALERPNLELRAGVTVDRIELAGGRARAVILTSGERLEADLIVLAAGAVGSPIILQRSGVGPAEVLERHGIDVVHPLPGVGRNLRDHPMLYPTWSADADAVGPLDPPLQAFCVCTSSGARGRGPDRPQLRAVHARAGVDQRRPRVRAPVLGRLSRDRLGRPRRGAGHPPRAVQPPGGPAAHGDGLQAPARDLRPAGAGRLRRRGAVAGPGRRQRQGAGRRDPRRPDHVRPRPRHVLDGAGRRRLGGRRPARQGARARGAARRRRLDHADDPRRAAQHDRDHDGRALLGVPRARSSRAGWPRPRGPGRRPRGDDRRANQQGVHDVG